MPFTAHHHQIDNFPRKICKDMDIGFLDKTHSLQQNHLKYSYSKHGSLNYILDKPETV